MLSHHHIQLKTINYYLSGIEEIYQLKTYSSFLGWLHHPGSNFQRYQGHQYQSQCKDTLLDCLNLQSNSQQLNQKRDCNYSTRRTTKKIHKIPEACNKSVHVYRLAMVLLLLGIDIGCKGLCQHLHHSSLLHQNHNHHDYFHHHKPHLLSSQG